MASAWDGPQRVSGAIVLANSHWLPNKWQEQPTQLAEIIKVGRKNDPVLQEEKKKNFMRRVCKNANDLVLLHRDPFEIQTFRWPSWEPFLIF